MQGVIDVKWNDDILAPNGPKLPKVMQKRLKTRATHEAGPRGLFSWIEESKGIILGPQQLPFIWRKLDMFHFLHPKTCPFLAFLGDQ